MDEYKTMLPLFWAVMIRPADWSTLKFPRMLTALGVVEDLLAHVDGRGADGDVKSTESRGDVVEALADRGAVANVDHPALRLAPRVLDGVGGGFDTGGVDIEAHHVGAEVGGHAGGGFADTGAGAHDRGDFGIESEKRGGVHLVFLFSGLG
jgi:hypothetical protein